MSDLVGGAVSNGRTQNGSSRAPGPVPQPYAGGDRVRTPTDIMRDRQTREAKKKAESERRQRELAEEERRRLQREENIGQDRRVVAAGVVPEGSSRRRSSGARRQGGEPSSDTGERRPADRESDSSTRANAISSMRPPTNVPSGSRTEKTSNTAEVILADESSIPQPRSRPRGATLSTGQPRPVETKPRQTPRVVSAAAATTNPRETSREYKNASLNATAGTSQPQVDRQEQASGAQSQPAQDPLGGAQTRSANTSSFPHAFERWETLSSHWEGLTSFWIRRLEQNKEDLDGNTINQQMARQVTDLSAAGANLFHAVVELQRLRASSERKFQRWFIETRAEQERFRESQIKFEERLRIEQQAAADAQAALGRLQKEKTLALADKGVAGRQVDERRRELDIAKKEARRAWDELGRREQEERDRTISLKQGQVTIVGGVQVVPMVQDASRQGSTHRPSTREGPSSGLTSVQGAQLDSPMEDEPGYTTYDAARSETDTDPFTEGGRVNIPQGTYLETDRITTTTTTSTNPYRQTSNTSGAAVQAARDATTSLPYLTNSQPVRSTAASSGSTSTYLNYRPDASTSATAQPGISSFYQHEGTSLQGQPHVTEADERSYVPSVEDTLSEEDYELNENGEIRRDAQGHPIPGSRRLGSEDSDEYDVRDQLERERMFGRSYGSSMSGVEYGSGPATAAGRQATQDAPADYSGSGFGAGWEAMPRHHHPTRLSDVLEEDERSRTSPSRASQHSRGIH
jgi:hypothetical protein